MTNFDIRYEVRKLQFYTGQRSGFWRFVAQGTQILSCILSTAAAITIFSGHAIAAAIVSLVAAAGCFFAMVSDADGNRRMFSSIEGKLLDFERTLPDSAETDVQQAEQATKDALYRIKADIPSLITCLDAMCDNQACISFGFPVRLRLNLIESWIGRYIPAVHYTEKAFGPLRVPVPPKPARQ